MRILVIGDIHGALKALKQCLKRSKYNPKTDQIIFLGDYVDGWSESAELIQFLIELQKESVLKHIFIRGNHDKWCEDWILTGTAQAGWVQQGGRATLESYIRTKHIIDEEHKNFFINMCNYYVDDENRGFVHGGFTSKRGLGYEPYETNYYWDRDLWSLALMQDNKFFPIPELVKEGYGSGQRFKNHKEIFIGHTSTINWKYKHNGVLRITNTTNPDCLVGKSITTPIKACNIWNMDTGGGFGGKVTIMDVNTKEYWQSDFVKTLYLNESGR